MHSLFGILVKHLFQQVSYTNMEQDLGKLGVFLFQKLKVLERNPLDILVVFYGTISLVISEAYRDLIFLHT